MYSTRKRTRLVAATALLTATALLGSACSSAEGSGTESGSQSSAAGSEETRTVETENGEIEIPAEPQKVVVLNNALAGYAYHLDLPVDATVAESTGKEGKPGQFWEEEAAENETTFLPWSNDGFDLEAILAAEPDLIIAGGIGFPYRHATQQYDELSDIAPTLVVPDSLDTWQAQFEFLADSVGKPEVFDEAEKTYNDRVAEVRDTIDLPPTPVAYYMQNADGKTYVANDEVGFPTALAEVGLEPAPLKESGKFESYGGSGDVLTISKEQITSELTMPTVFVLGVNRDVVTADELSQDPAFADLPAFADGHAYDLPYWVHRPDYDEALGTLDTIEELFG